MSDNEQIEANEICPVCLDTLVDKSIKVLQFCKHKVCQECFDQLLQVDIEKTVKQKCPLCRGPLMDSKLPPGLSKVLKLPVFKVLIFTLKATAFYIILIGAVALLGFVFYQLSDKNDDSKNSISMSTSGIVK